MKTRFTDKAMLVHLGKSLPTGTKKDRERTEEYEQEKGIKGRKQASVSRRLYPESFMSNISSLRTKANALIKTYTVPWPDDGWYVLPNANYMAFVEQARSIKAECDRIRDWFVDHLDEMKRVQMKEQVGFFKDDYPTPEELRDKFGIEYSFRPVPETGHFMAEMVDEELAQVDKTTNDAMQQAVDTLYDRMMEPVLNLIDQCSKKDGERRIYDTLLGNIRKVVEAAAVLNVTGDARIEDCRRSLDEAFSRFTTDEIRENDHRRDEAIRKARAVAEKMKGYMNLSAALEVAA